MERELFVSECQNCSVCSGNLTNECPRYAYWGEPSSTGYDSPHYTGVSETEIRERAKRNPGGTADAAVRAADGEKRLESIKAS